MAVRDRGQQPTARSRFTGISIVADLQLAARLLGDGRFSMHAFRLGHYRAFVGSVVLAPSHTLFTACLKDTRAEPAEG
jgi:hypothetical protein